MEDWQFSTESDNGRLAMLFIKQIITTIAFVLIIFIGTGYGETVKIPLYTIDEAIALKKENFRCIFVDTRKEKDFQTVRIPSSINISRNFIKTKAYLKDMEIILLNQGYSLSQLQREGALLKNQGFHVGILAGGIAAWHQQGQRLDGDLFAVQDLHYMPSVELLAESNNSYFKLRINVSSVVKKNVFQDKFLHQPVNSAEDLTKLIKVIEDKNLDSQSGVLISNENGDYSLLAALPKQCKPTIFFLKGGSNTYRLKVEQQQAILQPREQRIKKVGGCSTCPSTSNSDKKEGAQ